MGLLILFVTALMTQVRKNSGKWFALIRGNLEQETRQVTKITTSRGQVFDPEMTE